MGRGHHIHLLLRLGIELAQLPGQTMVALGHLPTFPLELLVANDFGQGDVQQPGLLAFELCEGLAHVCRRAWSAWGSQAPP